MLSFAIGHSVDAAVIAGVVVQNTVLGCFQEWRAEGALSALRTMAAHHARVLRNGKPTDIDTALVTTGDVLVLETGDSVAADARILSGAQLKVDESALTGESQPVTTQSDPLADRKHMVWMATRVTSDRGRAVVVETGMQTAMGKIAGDVRPPYWKPLPT